MVAVASGISVAVASATVLAADTAMPATGVSACRAAQMHFLRPSVQPMGPFFVGYSLTIRNVSSRPCALGHLIFVRLPRHASASIEVKPQLRSDLLPPIDLSRPLVVRPGNAVGTYVVVTAPCGGVHSSVELPIVIGADASPSAVEATITIRACRAVANDIALPPLANL